MLLLVVFVHFNLIFSYTPLRNDYYQSFTYPAICLNVSHYNPSGPLYFKASFIYKRLSIIPEIGFTYENAIYAFKKVNKSCESTILYTTMGEDLKYFNIIIEIYLFNTYEKMNLFEYKFYRGFTTGYYQLFNTNNDFSINLKIPELPEIFLRTYIKSFYDEQEFVNSISGGNGDLCILTENNNAVIIKPKYISRKPEGYISSISVIIERNKKFSESIKLLAFECEIHNSYPKEPVLLITDGKEYKAFFRVLSWKYFNSKPDVSIHNFEITNFKYDYINNIRKISRKYKIIFLMEMNSHDIKCPDMSESFVYYSKAGIKYFAINMNIVNVSYWVEMHRNFICNPDDPCCRLRI